MEINNMGVDNEDDYLSHFFDDFFDGIPTSLLMNSDWIDDPAIEVFDADICENHSKNEVCSSPSITSGSDTGSTTEDSDEGYDHPGRFRKHRHVSPSVFTFTRNLLFDPKYCPAIICWENYEEKTFRFRDTTKVAQLYGEFKKNPKMTYAKYTRAIRYHYQNKKKKANSPILFLKHDNKTKYRFGPDATGLETDDPNFVRYRKNRKYYLKIGLHCIL